MLAHTPGPWKIGPYYTYDVIREDGTTVARCNWTPQGSLDARLIAAAPRMLDLVADMLSLLPGMLSEDWDWTTKQSVKTWQAESRAILRDVEEESHG